MQTSAPNHAKARAAAIIARRALPRADRIRRLINRLDARLAQLRFAESIAYATAPYALQRGDSATTIAAGNLAVRAIRAAESIQHRAVRLSRAELRALQLAA